MQGANQKASWLRTHSKPSRCMCHQWSSFQSYVCCKHLPWLVGSLNVWMRLLLLSLQPINLGLGNAVSGMRMMSSCAVEGSFKPERRELLTQLYQLFSERPIWTTSALLEHIKIAGRAISHQEMEIYLPRLAYTFRSGE